MKIALQYLSNSEGERTAVQLSLSEWEKVLARLKKFEQSIQLKSEIKEALDEVDSIKKSKKNKQSLSDFINGL